MFGLYEIMCILGQYDLQCLFKPFRDSLIRQNFKEMKVIECP